MLSQTYRQIALEGDEWNALFILYTSGSTGKPKGVMHTTGGYLVYAAMTFKYVFDYQKAKLLVYCGCGLDYRSHLPCLRTACQWRENHTV